MDVKCMPIKEIFSNWMNGFKVISCIPVGTPPLELELSNYGNFTISGSNLQNLKIGQEISLNIRKDLKNKYKNSYILIGYTGINTSEKEIAVDPKQELNILKNLMSEDQAINVNKAYPNFIYLVLNGQETDINFKEIYNVGAIRLEQYIDKVKAACRSILFMPVAMDNGIEDSETIEKLTQVYLTPEELKEAFDTNPYHVYIDLVHYPFKRSDKLVLDKHPEFIDSMERCEYSCVHCLKKNEALGNTRISANELAQMVYSIAPESLNNIVTSVSTSEHIYYNKEHKQVSLKSTYEAEVLIVDNIQSRLDDSTITRMNWQDYVEVDGLKLTDEQQQILQVVQDNNVMILTGSAGCGKSQSMKALIYMLEDNGYSYTMLCPTGTAAQVLSKATNRHASTIHMFLVNNIECGDFLILEESSMIGVELLAMLLGSIPKETKIIFICDPSQLPSISCGNIVHDILESSKVPNVNLTKIFRYNSSGLIIVATDTRMGNPSSFANQYDDYKFIEESNNPIEQIVEEYDKLLSQGYNKSDILILSPYNKGTVGTYAINQAIQAKFNPNPLLDVSYKRDSTTIQFAIGDRVINKKNNYSVPKMEMGAEGYEETTEVMFVANGSIGVILAEYREDDQACFAIQFEDGIGKFKGPEIANLLLGYAVSIHASQGNQARAVIVVVSKEHKRMVQRNLLYVGLTRAQEHLTVIGDKEAIEDGMKLEETAIRNTWLGDMLKNKLDNSPKT